MYLSIVDNGEDMSIAITEIVLQNCEDRSHGIINIYPISTQPHEPKKGLQGFLKADACVVVFYSLLLSVYTQPQVI